LCAVHVANFRAAYSCDVLDPWIREDLKGFDTVHLDDYLEYILERCLQPGKAVKYSKGDGTPLRKAVYKNIHTAVKEHKVELGQIRLSLND
jgi:hypothetical protein